MRPPAAPTMASQPALRDIGFTGTRVGMTWRQAQEVVALLDEWRPRGCDRFHHGDCVGADRQAHHLALAFEYRIVLHPPENDERRAYCLGFAERRPRLPYLDRNQAIVDESDLLIATPKEMSEALRSGTWSTVRRARAKGIPVFIVLPDGTVQRG